MMDGFTLMVSEIGLLARSIRHSESERAGRCSARQNAPWSEFRLSPDPCQAAG